MPTNFDLFRIENPVIIDASVDWSIIDHDGDPSLVLDVNYPFEFRVHWNLTGMLPPALNGTFHVEAYAESIGVGPDVTLGVMDIPASIPSTPHTLHSHFNVPSAAILSLRNTYKLTAVLTYRNAFNTPMQLAGFLEGPMVQFYKAP